MHPCDLTLTDFSYFSKHTSLFQLVFISSKMSLSLINVCFQTCFYFIVNCNGMSVFSCAALTLPLDPNLATHASQREDGLQWDSPPASQASMDTSAPGCHLPQLRMVCSPRPHPFPSAVKQPASMFSFLHIESLSRQGWEFLVFFLEWYQFSW